MSELPIGDYGVLAALVFTMMGTFLWFVRAARIDLNRAHADFTDYLKETASNQTEALVSVGNALQASIEQSRAHEDRANRRHEQVMRQIAAIEKERHAAAEIIERVVERVDPDAP